jgi:methyltransferase (TIGR00027 family)
MKADRPSSTALFVAAARGLGAFLPESARLIRDPYGMSFGGPALRAFDKLATPFAERLSPRLRPSGRLELGILWLQLRTRVLDDYIAEFVAAGGRQVLLLGAGYDTRASRLSGLGADVAFFEVDHPATQRHKRAVLAREKIPADRARYLAWDFEAQPLAALPNALAGIGHDASAPTITIWEGVTMYLTESAIDASIRCVRSLSARGSAFAITYFEREAVRDNRWMKFFVSRLGEPMRFGWQPSELGPYLSERGFELVRDENQPEIARRLLPAAYATRPFTSFRRIALATVA